MSQARIHDYKLVSTLHWSGLVCQRCGDWVGKLAPPKGMITNFMGSRVCSYPVLEELPPWAGEGEV